MTDKNQLSASSDCILVNGNILTMDAADSVAEAIIIRNGRIEAIGSTADINSLLKSGEKAIDLQGKTVLPGFIDAHGHFPGSGLEATQVNLNAPPIGRMESVADVLEALKARAAITEKGNWVAGFGYDDTLMAEKRMLTREDLDSVSTEHPVYISHISGHIGAGNSVLLESFNLQKDTPDPEGGVIQRDPSTGEPNGILEEEAHFPVYMKSIDLSPEGMLKIVEHAVKDYTSHGVTTAQAGLCDREILEGLSGASQMGLIPIRIMAWPNIEMSEMILRGEFDPDPHNNDLYRIGAAKIIGDGSIQAFTANLSKPYHTPFKGDASHNGYPVTDRSTMTALVRQFHAAGMQIAIHANGDGTVDDILYAVGEAQREHPREDHRHIIIHCQTVRDDQLQRMKELGITASFFPAHAYYWGDRHCSIFLGEERAFRQNPTRTARDMGIPFTIHVDTPVTPMRTLLSVWAAVNRTSTGGRVIGPDERISALQALHAVTSDAAWQIFQEDVKGSLEPGKFGDLVILSDNPLDRPETIREIKVLQTIVGGRTVYDSRDS